MHCSEPGIASRFAIVASRGPGRWVVRRSVMSKTFQKIWAGFIAVFAAILSVLAVLCGRRAYLGFPNASGDPEGISLARFAMGIIAFILTVLTFLFVVMLVRGIKRLRHDTYD